MNQEQNNWNTNTQYNNPISNNQTLDNSLNQNIQEPIQVQNNTFTNNNGDNNNNSSKKTKLFLIIGIVVILLIIIVLLIAGTFNNKNNNEPTNNNQTNNEQINNNPNVTNLKIKEITIDGGPNIVALTENNELYVIGKESYDELSLGENTNYTDVPTKVADNVKKLFYESGATYYLDNNNKLYTSGLSMSGGTNKTFVEYETNVDVDSIYTYNGLCLFIVDKEHKMYVHSLLAAQCGLDNRYTELTELASDVKYSYNYLLHGGYISTNNELYYSNSDKTGYRKIADDIKKVSKDGIYVLSNDKVLYENNMGQLEKISDDVIDIDEDGLYFVKEDGKLYIGATHYSPTAEKLLSFSQIEGYANLNAADVKDVLYVNINMDKFVYLNSKSELMLYDNNGTKNVGNTVNALKEVLKFIEG